MYEPFSVTSLSWMLSLFFLLDHDNGPDLDTMGRRELVDETRVSAFIQFFHSVVIKIILEVLLWLLWWCSKITFFQNFQLPIFDESRFISWLILFQTRFLLTLWESSRGKFNSFGSWSPCQISRKSFWLPASDQPSSPGPKYAMDFEIN